MIRCLSDARTSIRAWLAIALICLPVLAPEATLAGQIQLSPLSLSLTPDQRATTITLRNEADAPVSLQIRAFAWQTDIDTGILLAPTQDIALSPAMVTLPAGATQLIRVVARNPQRRGAEQYYRILIDELPSAARASRNKIQVLTRYSLPLFLEPYIAGLPKLALQLQQCQDGRQRLLISNTGERRARLANWLILDGEQTLASQPGLAGYALPGSQLALAVPTDLAWPAAGAKLRADTDLGPWQADIPSPGEPTSCQPPAVPL